MDLVVVSNYRPQRLLATLGTVLTQQIVDPCRNLFLVDNSDGRLAENRPLEKMLLAFEKIGWNVQRVPCEARTISQVKKFAYSLGSEEYLVCIDNDVLFTRATTIRRMLFCLRHYDIGAVSPIAFDIDDERPVLAHDSRYYRCEVPDWNGVAEGLTALGLCLGFRRRSLETAMRYWCVDLPYMEDQVLIHFVKAEAGYAHLHDHVVYHVGLNEEPSYVFNNGEVIAYLQTKVAEHPEFQLLLQLRIAGLDGADFPRPVRKR